jgi:uncharacterized protein
MPINAHPEYLYAEKQFHQAETDEDRLKALEEMIRHAPSHKGGENLRVQLKSRYKKLKQKLIKNRKTGKSSKKGIKKSDMQAIILGFTNTGKSSILKALTNKDVQIASYGFTTQEPEQGMLNHQGCNIQLIDLPPLGSERFEKSLLNTTDTIILVIEKLNELKELQKVLKNSKNKAKQILVFNKIDLHDQSTKRKISETLKSKKQNFIITSTKTNEGLEDLKEKIFKSFNKIRVYSKQPNQEKHDNVPLILKPKSTVQKAAEKLLHGNATTVKKIRIWGPSSKFSGQIIGIKHQLKDKDILEFTTK